MSERRLVENIWLKKKRRQKHDVERDGQKEQNEESTSQTPVPCLFY